MEPTQRRPRESRRSATDRQRSDVRLPAASSVDLQGSFRHSATCPSGTRVGSAAGRWSAILRRECSIHPSGWHGSAPLPTLGWLTVGHLVWGGLGVYLLLRSFAQGRWAATVAAGVYLASPYLLAHTFEGHYPHVWAAAWYPWAFWAIRASATRAPRGRLLLPVFLALRFWRVIPRNGCSWLLALLGLGPGRCSVGLENARGKPGDFAALRLGWHGAFVARTGRDRAGAAAWRPALAACATTTRSRGRAFHADTIWKR